MTKRRLSRLDRFLISVDQAVRTVFGSPPVTERINPAMESGEPELSETERQLSAGLMRVNHAGEICAQALYQGQALTARLSEVRDSMERAALEENDHLAWTRQRLDELDDHTSYLNPFWYAGSFSIGAFAGLLGDRWSLGFVAETERQVVNHLEGHLQRIPPGDTRSRAIIEQMREDEARHATVALEAGGADLPGPVRRLMTLASRVMTMTAFRI